MQNADAAGDALFDLFCTVDDTAVAPSSPVVPSLTFEDLMGEGSATEGWGTLLAPAEAPSDEPAAFVLHMNRDAPELSCESPTQITSSLQTPAAKAKHSKPRTFKAAAPAKTKRAKVEGTTPAASAAAAEPREEPSSVPASDSETVVEEVADVAADGAPTPPLASDDETKRVQRMLRNRASAAESRKRKRQQLEDYETLVASLTEAVQKLKQQNEELRRACALAGGKPLETPSQPIPAVGSA